MKKFLFLTLVFLVFHQNLFSQNIRHLTVDDGLPQSFVSALVQDQAGFIWIGTRNGLARYDGHQFKTIRHNINNNNSLSSNVIDHLQKDKKNNLWIKYESGEIDQLNLNSFAVKHIINLKFLQKNKLDIHRMHWLVAKDGTLWFKTKKNRLYHYDIQNKKLLYNYIQKLDKDEIIYGISEDQSANIWILTQKHLWKFDSKKQISTKIAIPYPAFQSQITGKSPEAVALLERGNGEIMWADKNQLYFFNPEKKSFRTAKLPLPSSYNIKWIDNNFKSKEYFISNNSILEYSQKSGVKTISKLDFLKDKKPQAFLVDYTGLFWIGNDSDGIYTIDTSLDFMTFQYKNGFLNDVLQDQFKISNLDFFNWNYDIIGTLKPAYYFRSSGKYIALNRMVCFVNEKDAKLNKFPELPSSNSTNFNPITGISAQNNTIIAADKTNSFYKISQGESKWQYQFSLEGKFKKAKINNIHWDAKSQIIWITTEMDGLLYYNLKNRKVKQFASGKNKLPSNSLISIEVDLHDENYLWIGSTEGLVHFNKNTFQTKIFSINEGLPDNVIYSMLTDKNGNLWMGTNKGLVNFNTKNFKTRIFTKNQGLQNIEFNRFHQLLLPDGRMVFGGNSDGVIFNPEKVVEDQFSSQIAITTIKINNKELESTAPDFLQPNRLKSISLKHFENTVSFVYTALDYSQPQVINYRYRLKNHQKEWFFAGNSREAIYTKLPPGNYVFEVNASNSSGKWSKHIKSIEIEIASPWWKTWWAIFTYLLLIGTGIYFFFKFKINQNIIKNEIILRKKETDELRKLDEIKTEFFSQFAHEFRTPLSLILAPAEQMASTQNVELKNKLFTTIKKNTNSLLLLTDQLIDMAKLEAGVLKPQMVWGNIMDVISPIFNSFANEAESKNVTLLLEAPETLECTFSTNSIDRILYNLLSNSLKFCTSGDQILVKLYPDANGIFLIVKDTGTGIPEEEQDHIFEKYYKGSNQKLEQGTGIGLALVNDLLQLHKGTISVESSTQIPAGTTFVVFLPTEIAENEALQIEEKSIKQNEKPTILVVEDHAELLQFIVDNLADIYTIITAENGKIALEIALEKMPDLIVSDVSMKEMDGFEFCKLLKNNININHIPIILLTAKADEESRLKGLSFGANDYLTKPFGITELKLRIANLLSLQKKHLEYLNAKFKIEEITDETESENSVSQEFLNKINSIIEENLDNKEFSVDDLASSLSMSRTNLHRKVKALFNIPTGEIIKIYRLKKAAELLKKNYNISEVAYMTGFNTPSYFTKCFKEYFGVTPTKHSK